ncbi:hypothetical protein BVJ53_00165 [Lacticaseibacillus chiayiensis]|uniref:MFS transporter n=1 Tax=Lacticaseibacillus chiayiensis TaxID=2100821 RepID=A0A4Q1UHI2_9LACO|nr:hypothetical protein [Lacticaseibacillus chiayiensis]RXT30667.1 hypothetical protein BVJ53_00165 [Lacticaseibacillus chiayiensis]UYN56377.1 hypothetical protein OFW50_13065 [Lacticaseibacillus chiayiensis]
MNVTPLTTGGKWLQGGLFAVANLISLLPLLVFATLYRDQSPTAYLPYIFFYTGTKTGLLLVNGFGDVQNAYRLARNCLWLCVASLILLNASSQPVIQDTAAFVLGCGASAFLPAYQAVYYRERRVWHWNFATIEMLGFLLYSIVTLGLILLGGQIRTGFWVLLAFVTGGLVFLLCLPKFAKSLQTPTFVAKTSSKTDLELFFWLTAIVFCLRFTRFFANSLGVGLMVVFTFGFFLFILRIALHHQIRIDFPWWLIQSSFINGVYETFAMLYILFAIHDQGLMIGAYIAYGLGLILAQVVRQAIQNKFRHIANLQLQLLGFMLGSWLMLVPVVSPAGFFLIGFIGSANSILLNHQVYRFNLSTPANRLAVKYRNAYLGSILLQAMLVFGGLIAALLTHTDLTSLFDQANAHSSVVISYSLVRLVSLGIVVILTVITFILGRRLPRINERKLF